MNFIKYIAPDGEDWRAEDGEKLLSDFGIPIAEGREQMPRWHQAFSNQEPGFEVLCRVYAVNPMIGVTDPEMLRPWTGLEVASQLGMGITEVTELREDARKFWERWLKSHVTESMGRSVEIPRERDESEITRLLLENGFHDIKRTHERAYIANRVDELGPWLESEQSRAVARSLIHQEVGMAFILDTAIAATRDAIEEKKARTPPHDASKEGEQLMKLMKERREQQAGIDSTMKQLGMDEARNSTTKKKMAFKDIIGTLMDGVAKYYSDGDHELIDFIRTAAEIELETKPLTLRPQQYRPDVTVACWEAMQNFWNRDYVPTPVARKVQRRLRAGFEQGLALVRSENGETIQSMGETGDDAEAMVEGSSNPGVQYQPVKLAVDPAIPRPSRSSGESNLEV